MGRSFSSAWMAARSLPRFMRRPPRPPRPRGPNPGPKPGPQPPNAARSSRCLARLFMARSRAIYYRYIVRDDRGMSALGADAVEDALRQVGRAGQLDPDPHRELPAGVAQADLVDRDRPAALPGSDLAAQRTVPVRAGGARNALAAVTAERGGRQEDAQVVGQPGEHARDRGVVPDELGVVGRGSQCRRGRAVGHRDGPPVVLRLEAPD